MDAINIKGLSILSNDELPSKRILTLMTQTAIICSKLTVETLEQGLKYIQS